jgi:hypothetical protein
VITFDVFLESHFQLTRFLLFWLSFILAPLAVICEGLGNLNGRAQLLKRHEQSAQNGDVKLSLDWIGNSDAVKMAGVK